MPLNFPVLRKQDGPYLPIRGGDCPVCGNKLTEGVAFLTGGTLMEDPDLHNMNAFFSVGYHSKAIDVSGCASVDVVDHVRGDQFELSFCSTRCLRRFFSDIVGELERCLAASVSQAPD